MNVCMCVFCFVCFFFFVFFFFANEWSKNLYGLYLVKTLFDKDCYSTGFALKQFKVECFVWLTFLLRKDPGYGSYATHILVAEN